MAKRKSTTAVDPKTVLAPMSMAELPMDTESRQEVGPRIGSVRDNMIFFNVALAMYAESLWGAFATVKTGTDTVTSRIFVYKGDPLDPTAIKVNRSGTQNQLSFSIFVPLQKLKVQPTADRQWDLVAVEQPILDGPPAFVFNVSERTSVPRNLNQEAQAASGKQETQGKKGAAASADLDDDDDDDDDDPAAKEAFRKRMVEANQATDDAHAAQVARQEAQLAKWDAEAAAKRANK